MARSQRAIPRQDPASRAMTGYLPSRWRKPLLVSPFHIGAFQHRHAKHRFFDRHWPILGRHSASLVAHARPRPVFIRFITPVFRSRLPRPVAALFQRRRPVSCPPNVPIAIRRFSRTARTKPGILIGGAINDEIRDFVNVALGTSVGKFDKVAKGPAARVEARIVR
jgi:hypothetical protein